MKKLIALIALIIVNQSAHAMKALNAKQKQVAQAQKSGGIGGTVNVEEYVKALYELQQYAFDNVGKGNFGSEWVKKYSAFTTKYPQAPTETTVVNMMLNIVYRKNLSAPGKLLSDVFKEANEASTLEQKWDRRDSKRFD